MKMAIAVEEITKKASDLEKKSAEEILKWALDAFGSKIALASSFQCEESVLLNMMHKLVGNKFRVFTLDTGRLNEETYEVMEEMREKYGIRIESQFPDREAVEKLEKEKGLYSFRTSIENRKECCGIRKIVPLNRMLGNLEAWITGLRAEQSVTRTATPKIETDVPRKGLTKVNPLIDWTTPQVWEIKKKEKGSLQPPPRFRISFDRLLSLHPRH